MPTGTFYVNAGDALISMWLVHQGAGDHDPLRLPAGDEVGLAVGPLAQAELLQQRVGARAPLGPRTPW